MTFLLQKLSSESKLLNKINENNINSGQNRVAFLSNSKHVDKIVKGPTKSLIPNVTLQPIGINKYQAKHHSRWL